MIYKKTTTKPIRQTERRRPNRKQFENKPTTYHQKPKNYKTYKGGGEKKLKIEMLLHRLIQIQKEV